MHQSCATDHIQPRFAASQIQARAYFGLDEALLLHQGSTLSLLLLPLPYAAAQDLDLLHHPHSMAGVARPERQLLQEHSLRKP